MKLVRGRGLVVALRRPVLWELLAPGGLPGFARGRAGRRPGGFAVIRRRAPASSGPNPVQLVSLVERGLMAVRRLVNGGLWVPRHCDHGLMVYDPGVPSTPRGGVYLFRVDLQRMVGYRLSTDLCVISADLSSRPGQHHSEVVWPGGR